MSYISKYKIFLKNRFHSNIRSYFINFRPKTKKILRAAFENNIKVSDFGLIWRHCHKYLQIMNFSKQFGPVTFLPLWSPNVMQKIRKILWAVSEKTVLPINQPTNYYLQHRSYRTLLTLVQLNSDFQLTYKILVGTKKPEKMNNLSQVKKRYSFPVCIIYCAILQFHKQFHCKSYVWRWCWLNLVFVLGNTYNLVFSEKKNSESKNFVHMGFLWSQSVNKILKFCSW